MKVLSRPGFTGSVFGATLAILGCAGGGPDHLPGYSRPFHLDGSFLAGEAGADGLQWRPQPLGAHYQGVVVATWCPACESMLDQRERDAGLRKATANIFYLETELERRVNYLTEHGALSSDERRAANDALASGQLLAYPERLSPGARFVQLSQIPAEWFPFFFTCEANTCEGWAAAF